MEFIAEIGMNYNTNKGLIPEMVRLASNAGADYAKLQLGWRDKPGEINNLSTEDILRFSKSCNYYGIKPLFSIISLSAWEMFENTFERIDTVKIASRTLKYDKDLILKIQEKAKRLIISTGMDSKEEGLKHGINGDYLWCVSKYPAFPEDIRNMPENFIHNGYSGFSDHTHGISASLIAISRGAKVIERHFTLDKSDSTIRDHSVSSTPDEFKEMVQIGREIAKLYEILNSETGKV